MAMISGPSPSANLCAAVPTSMASVGGDGCLRSQSNFAAEPDSSFRAPVEDSEPPGTGSAW